MIRTRSLDRGHSDRHRGRAPSPSFSRMRPRYPRSIRRPKMPLRLNSSRRRGPGTLGDCAVLPQTGWTAIRGRARVETPFGTIRTTNITPDKDTGIGTWSEAAFTRAMREGVGRDGQHLYPAFPFQHFAKVTTEDIQGTLRLRHDTARREVGQRAAPTALSLRPEAIAGWMEAAFPGSFCLPTATLPRAIPGMLAHTWWTALAIAARVTRHATNWARKWRSETSLAARSKDGTPPPWRTCPDPRCLGQSRR